MLELEDWMEIRSLSNQGLSISEIARKLNIDRKTVRKHLNSNTQPVYTRKEMPSKLDEYKSYIEERLDKYNLTSQKIYEEIQKQSYTGKYGIVNLFVQEVKENYKHKARLRFETLPGEQAQVDWGYFGTMYDKEQRRTISLNCFFIILGYSRTLYIEFFDNTQIINFLKGHNNAFSYFGGYTKDILYDNLKSVVIKRALRAIDSQFNLKFMDFAGYYGFKPILCRPYKPNTKGKVENSVNYAKQNFFAGETFQSLRELNERAHQWLSTINNRMHATTKEIPFVRLEKENLIPLESRQLYDLTEICYRRVCTDCHFNYKANKYSVPYQYAGKEIIIKHINDMEIAIFHREKKIAEHNLHTNAKGIYITIDSHLEGLSKIRCSHPVKRRKNQKKKMTNTNSKINLIQKTEILPEVAARNLNIYDEVTQ